MLAAFDDEILKMATDFSISAKGYQRPYFNPGPTWLTTPFGTGPMPLLFIRPLRSEYPSVKDDTARRSRIIHGAYWPFL